MHSTYTNLASNQVIRGGEKIAAEEVENELLGHELVQYAALISVSDPVLGEKICAILVCPEQAPKPIVLRKFLRQRGLADYKIPDRFEFIEQLPLTPVGKVNKKQLQALFDPVLSPA